MRILTFTNIKFFTLILGVSAIAACGGGGGGNGADNTPVVVTPPQAENDDGDDGAAQPPMENDDNDAVVDTPEVAVVRIEAEMASSIDGNILDVSGASNGQIVNLQSGDEVIFEVPQSSMSFSLGYTAASDVRVTISVNGNESAERLVRSSDQFRVFNRAYSVGDLVSVSSSGDFSLDFVEFNQEDAGDIQFTEVITSNLDGGVGEPDHVFLDDNGDIYITRLMSPNLTRVNASDGSMDTISLGAGANPVGLDTDSNGNLLIADFGADRVLRLLPDDSIEVVATNVGSPAGLVVNSQDEIFVSIPGGQLRSDILQVFDNGTSSLFATGNGIQGPIGLALDENENILVANFTNGLIHRVTPAGSVSNIGDMGDRINQITYVEGQIYALRSGVVLKMDAVSGEVENFIGTTAQENIDGNREMAEFIGQGQLHANSDGTRMVTVLGDGTVRFIQSANN